MKRLCSILGVSRSSFYYWRRTASDRAARQAVDAQLAARIRAVHQESDGTYGAPRITAELRETNGEAVNHKRVARIMRASGIEGVRLRRGADASPDHAGTPSCPVRAGSRRAKRMQPGSTPGGRATDPVSRAAWPRGGSDAGPSCVQLLIRSSRPQCLT
ncbi:IS3 family transposase [Streptomyces sp. NBC_00316]|uniref:IS3 family transposase n=1 Tax=Streptomyces sp. NBC_00316 TaxID=2975710 RepID=UPI003FA74184